MTVRECRNCSVCIATLCTVVWLHGVHSDKIGLNHCLVAYLHILVQQLHASLLLNRKLLSQFGCIKYNKLPVCCLESAHCQAVQHFYTACITVTKRKLSHLPYSFSPAVFKAESKLSGERVTAHFTCGAESLAVSAVCFRV